jgi:hypothetical protein
MRNKGSVNIDLKQLSETAHVGVRRAVLFMGLGLNAAHRPDFNDYELHKLPHVPGQATPAIDFFPSNLPPERVNEFKLQFAIWITGCGLRELLEYYALFLDHVHRYSLLVCQVRNRLGELDPVREQRIFNRRFGIPRKLDVLEKRFSIAPFNTESIKQLYLARNCLTHNLGIIGPQHCGNGDRLILQWNAFDVVATGIRTGNEQSYPHFMGRTLDEESTISVRRVNRQRQFAIGEKLHLSQQDLSEICYFFADTAIPTALQSFIAFLEANEIPMDGKDGAIPTS